MKNGSGSFQGDLVAQMLDATRCPSHNRQAVPGIKVIFSQLLIGHAVSYHIVDGHQDRMGNRSNGVLPASSRRQPAILGSKIFVLGFGCILGRRSEGSF
jgi:hypothetical protein